MFAALINNDSPDQSIPLNSQAHFLFHFITLFPRSILTIVIIIGIRIEKFPTPFFFFLSWALIQLIAIFKTWRESGGGGEGCRVETAHSVNVFSGSINRIFVARSIKIYHLNFNSLYTHKICTLFCCFFLFVFSVLNTLRWAHHRKEYNTHKNLFYCLSLYYRFYFRFFFSSFRFAYIVLLLFFFFSGSIFFFHL